MQHSFSKLRVLEVVECADLRFLFTVAMASSFRKLEQLIVSSCPVLKSLIHVDEGENAGAQMIKFKELKFLALNDLPELGSLCDTDVRLELPQLVELRLDGLPNFTTIYPDNARQPFFNKQVVIPNLEKLKISSMKKLVQIWPHEITTSSSEEVQIPMIKVMKVEDCESLVNLFPTNPMSLLRNLEKLQVKTGSIEVLFNIDSGSFGKTEEVSSSLRLIHVVDSENIIAIWRIEGANNSSHLIRCFKAVEKIIIHGCRSYSHIFTPPPTYNFVDMRALVEVKTQDADSLFKRTLKSLQPNNKTRMMAISGMGGVGKTHMMERLLKAVVDFRMFTWAVKVVVGRNLNLIALQDAVAESIGSPLPKTSIHKRANYLANRFEDISEGSEKKILMILDDVWENLDLTDIGLPSPLPDGFKLLLTSRDENVCTQMGVEKSSIYTVPFLSKEEAKTLFYGSVGLSDHSDADPQLHEIAEDIIESCHGIPFHIKLAASSLINERGKDVWLDVLKHLKDNISSNDLNQRLYDLKYQRLQTEYQKEIFLLTGLFPGDTHIPVEELVRYVWGLKLLADVSTLAEARQIIETSVDALVCVNFLTGGYSEGCVTMHPNVVDFALSNNRHVKHALIHNGNMSKFPADFNYPNLRLLKLVGEKELLHNGNMSKFSQDFYDRMKNLEVVAFERIYNPLLPHFSINLRTLRLDSCSLMDDDLSFLGSLINLEILSFAHCRIRKLPSTVGKLRKLKLLDVTGCSHDLCIDDGVFENLDMLEELYLRVNGSKAICFTDANCEELEILSRKLCALEVELYKNKLHLKDESFKNLERFKISMGCQLVKGYDLMHYYENTLALVSNLSEVVECKINELFDRTKNLYLQVKDMKNLIDVSLHYYSFCNLRVLKVSSCADLTLLFTLEVASGLTTLEILNVSWCPLLETLIHGESGGGGGVIMFPKLKSLSLEKLPRLMSLCDMENRVELPKLVKLWLDGLPNFTTIYPDNAEQQYALFNKQVQIPNLEELTIHSMEKLMQVWPREDTATGSEKKKVNNNISMLRFIEVEGCESLVNLFPCNPLPLLNHLQFLTVVQCCSIEVLFNMDIRGAGKINNLTSSLRVVHVKRLEKLRHIWRIKGVSNSVLAIRCFQDVEHIYIDNRRRFRDIFTPTNINFVIKATPRVDM